MLYARVKSRKLKLPECSSDPKAPFCTTSTLSIAPAR